MSGVGVYGFLQIEVAVLEHARRFDHSAELQLAPLATYIRRAQCLYQPAGLGLQRLLRLVQRAQLLGQR